MLEIPEPTPEGKAECVENPQGKIFTFLNPPPPDWWTENFPELKKSTAQFLFRFQYWVWRGNLSENGESVSLGEERYFVRSMQEWCKECSGRNRDTVSAWRDDAKRAGLMTCKIRANKGHVKRQFFRPTDKFLSVFGLTLADYDVAGGLGFVAQRKPKIEVPAEHAESIGRWLRATDRSHPGHASNADKARDTVQGAGTRGFIEGKPVSSCSQVEQLFNVWKNAIEERGEYVAPRTGKQTEQFKAVYNACPPGEAAEVVGTIVKNWGDFITALERDHGRYKLSKSPDLDVLTRDIAAGVDFHRKQLADKAEQAAHEAARDAMVKAPKIKPEKPAQPALVEDFGVVIPEGAKPQWNGDELVFYRYGVPVSTPEQKYARMILTGGVVKALGWWISSGNAGKGPVPQHPERYFRGDALREILQLLEEQSGEFGQSNAG